MQDGYFEEREAYLERLAADMTGEPVEWDDVDLEYDFDDEPEDDRLEELEEDWP